MGFDSFIVDGFGDSNGSGGPNGFGDSGDDCYEMDIYGMEIDDELDEHEEKLLLVANSLGLYPGNDFEATLENACYMCNVDPDEFDEEERAELEEMME